jgi:hypothetical protein
MFDAFLEGIHLGWYYLSVLEFDDLTWYFGDILMVKHDYQSRCAPPWMLFKDTTWVKMHSKTRFVFMFQFSHHSFGPLMTTRLKSGLFLQIFVLCCIFSMVWHPCTTCAKLKRLLSKCTVWNVVWVFHLFVVLNLATCYSTLATFYSMIDYR